MKKKATKKKVNDFYTSKHLKEIDSESYEEGTYKTKVSEIGKDITITKSRKLGRNESCHCGSGKKYKKCCLDKDIKETGKPFRTDDLWEEGYFAETLSPNEIEEKQKTMHMGHDECLNYNCRKCNQKISAHNKDWHAGLCDNCFNEQMD